MSESLKYDDGKKEKKTYRVDVLAYQIVDGIHVSVCLDKAKKLALEHRTE